ncbi:hypothetical protein [Pengzhenrongella sp.]|uniref:hypothetical protein n=1 Tax=Pengzhenrongella sp. TaxID=2888820 RepID=UPI002F956642
MSKLWAVLSQVHVALDVENRGEALDVGMKGPHEAPRVREERLLSLLGLWRTPLAHHDERARVQIPVVNPLAAQRAHDLNRHAPILSQRLLPHGHATVCWTAAPIA